MHRAASLFLLLLILTSPIAAQSKEKPKWPPSPHVAATEPLRPEEQLKKMKVPPGFEIQLVAADPDIRKPININFDAAGRLWLTETIEYPFAAPEGKGRDAVKILEDFGPDGRARKITTFVDNLNIPIGVLPTSKGALVYSIPNISHMIDSKGTGKADVREPLYTGFGADDTHGMTGEFQQGFDGWIYACHGFRNRSNVKSRGDTAITMQSGNTYRIKADGSRIEHYTYGQVNPFGLAFDPYGNLFSGDCHSRPLTMLIRGALYEHFGNKHDGLGFAPHMNTFKDHSTALCGVTYYAADQYPKEYHGKLFLGDVVLNRLNAYRLDWNGASPAATMENFITSSDPWFRPVDIKLGPDGCLYFADFYNRIIGHSEIDLKHPGRDRDKGRIWRVVYRGPDGKGGPQPVVNLAKADVLALVGALGNANLTVRLQATHQLVERGGAEVAAALKPMLKDVEKAGAGPAKAHALWVLERLGRLDDDTLAQAASAHEKDVRVHVQRILTEKRIWTPKYTAMAKLGLDDRDPLVQRVAVEAMAAHPASDHVAPLLQLRQKSPGGDTHLIYAVRLALREQLASGQLWRTIGAEKLEEPEQRILADVCLGLRNAGAARFLMAFLDRMEESAERTQGFVHHAIRQGPDETASWALRFGARKYANAAGQHAALLKIVLQALYERGGQGLLSATDYRELEARTLAFLTSKDTSALGIGAELAGTLKVAKAHPELLRVVKSPAASEGLRRTCVTSLITIDAKQSILHLEPMLLSDKELIAVREQVASALASTNHSEAHAALVKALQNAPARLQTTIALGMAGSAQGGDRLLQAIEAGKASPRLLQDIAISFRIGQAKVANAKDRLKKLTAGMPPADQKAQELIAKRRDAFASFKADADLGQKIFAKQCANCHQVASQGAKIGPQLDGIGVRGLERILEDVLDPNRNVDQAFRTTIIATKDGKSHSGLFLREEGNIVILADKDGKDVRIDKAIIDERVVSPLSPMPSNFAELVSELEFNHLMAYLLAQRGKQ